MAAALLLPTFYLTRPNLAANSYRSVFMLTLFASPLVFEKFAEYRAYLISVSATAAYVLTIREIALLSLRGQPVRRPLQAWLFLMTLVAFNLEYFATVVGAATAAAFAFQVWRTGDRRAAMFIAGTAAVAGFAACLAFGLGRSFGNPVPPYQVSIARGTAGIVVAALSGAILALPCLPAQFPLRQLGAIECERAKVGRVLFVSLVVSIIGLLAVLLLTRAVLVRHAIATAPLAAAAAAEYATLTRIRRARLFLAAAITSAAVTTAVQSQNRGWEEFGNLLHITVASCPTSKLIALDPALLTRSSASYSGASQAIRDAYLGVAARWSLPIRLAGKSTGSEASSPRCPTLIWVEHNWIEPRATAASLAKAARIRVDLRQVRNAVVYRGNDSSEVVVLPPERQ